MRNDNAGGGLRGLRAEVSEPLLESARKVYGIDFTHETSDLGGSSSLNLKLTAGTKDWVLRVYRPYVTPERLRAINKVRRILSSQDIPCNAIVQTQDGKPGFSFRERCVELESYVAHDGNMNTWESLTAGMPMMARLHAILEAVKINKDGRYPLFANYIAPNQVLSKTLQGTQRIRAWYPTPSELEAANQADLLVKRLVSMEQALQATLPVQIVHGDFWDSNVFLRSGKIAFVTDFDFMGERARIDDLALTLYFTCMNTVEQPVTDDQLKRLRQLLDAYDSGADKPLTSNERLALPLAIARQPLWSIGGWVAQLDDESTARTHAAATAAEVKWALKMMDDIDRWQEAFV